VSGYDYPAFLESVRRVRRTAPTGCYYCDVVLPETCGPAATRAMQRLCEERSAFVVDAHHVIPKQVLKREFPEGAVHVREAVHGVAGLVLGESRWLPYDARLALVPPGGDPATWKEHVRTLDDLLMDERNGVLLRRYCHDQIEARNRSIPLLHVPESVIDFANELGLGWYLDKMDDRRTG